VTVEVFPATSERWDDVAAVFAGDGPKGCWCHVWRTLSPIPPARGDGSGELNLRTQVETDPTPPGLLAYDDGVPSGWIRLGPRDGIGRLVRSRTIPRVDDVPVWSIVCFKVLPGHRRKGVARSLLAGAVEFARASGAPALEAYPIDAEGRRLDVSFSFVGFTSMFEAAAFRRVVATDAHSAGRPRILMRLDLTTAVVATG